MKYQQWKKTSVRFSGKAKQVHFIYRIIEDIEKLPYGTLRGIFKFIRKKMSYLAKTMSGSAAHYLGSSLP